MTLDYSGISLANRNSGHIHFLTDFKSIDAYACPGNKTCKHFLRYMEFLQDMASLHRGLCKMPGGRLIHATGAALAKSDLGRGITIGIYGFELGNAIVGHVQHCYGLAIAILRKNASHANLAADKS